MIKASTVPSTAEVSRPIPAALFIAAVSQRPAAVVSPSMSSGQCRLGMVPALHKHWSNFDATASRRY
jgi:hypothetical protein